MDSESKGIVAVLVVVTLCITFAVNTTITVVRKVHRNVNDEVKLIQAKSADRNSRLNECVKIGGNWHDEYDGFCVEKK